MENAATLYDLHRASGLTVQQVAERMSVFEGAPRHYTSVSKILSRGTTSVDVLGALAHAYDKPRDEIEEAARLSRVQGLPPSARRRPRKIHPA